MHKNYCTFLKKLYLLFIVLPQLIFSLYADKSYGQSYVFGQLKGSPVNTTGWNLIGSAYVGNIAGTGDSEVIVCPTQFFVTGAVFYNKPINLSVCNRWIAEFDFRIFDGTLADGLAFCFLDVPPSGFVAGGGMGIPATANGLKVCFDPNPNCFPLNFAIYPKIEIRWGAGYDECWTQPTVDNSTGQLNFIRSDNYNHAKIVYNNGNISVYVNSTLYLTGFQQFAFSGYMGFTAATGAKDDNHSVKNVVIYTDMPPSEAGNDQTVCSGQPVQIGTNPNNGYAYTWQPATDLNSPAIANPIGTIINNTANTISLKYYVNTALDSVPGCFSQDSVTIIVKPSVSVPGDTISASICTGNSYTLPSGTVVNGPGIFRDTLKNSLGCDSIISVINLIDNNPKKVTVDTTISYGQTYLLPSGIIVNTGGTYRDTLKNLKGCDSLIVTTNLAILGKIFTCSNFGVINHDTTLCPQVQLQLNAKNALSYTWMPSNGINNTSIQNPVLTADSTRKYYLTSLGYSGNLVVNGDFEQGNAGFFTSYTYCNTNNCLYPLANDGYSVGTNANFYHILFQGKDHTTGSGNFMIVNGADPNLVVWRETINVNPNTNYAFGAWVSTVITVNPSQIRFSINGIQLGPIFNAPSQINQWEQVFTTWNSGLNTTATIEIVDIFNQSSGNDFGLDDIFFAEPISCVDSIMITVPSSPKISITASANNVCPATSVTFSANSGNAGPTPSYQWELNGNNVGSNNQTYTNKSLSNGDIISCIITSNATCYQASKDTSNSIVINVSTPLIPGVSIISSTNNICPGHGIIFTATPTNGGNNPIYLWQLNGTNTGTNSPSYSNNTLANGDIVTCTMTSNATCVTNPVATSNKINITVNSPLTPAVTIVASTNNICIGSPITFNAAPTNGGSTPSYQWKLNGADVGANSSSYTNFSLKNNDIVGCVMTSNESCITNATAISNNIGINVLPAVNASLSIASNTNNICAGSIVTFTATPINGGNSPSYQWQVNGVNAGTNNATFVTSSLANADVVSCIMTGSLNCSLPVLSTNTINLNIDPIPTVSLGPDKEIPLGGSVQLLPTINGDISTYLWSPSVGLNNVDIVNPVASPAVTTLYKLDVTSTSGCINTASITVKVINNEFGIPNAFTPNGDGHNDVFYIVGSKDVKIIKEFSVYNRWGMMVFHTSNAPSNNTAFGWNGFYKGQEADVGTYVYFAQILMNDGRVQIYKGAVTLIR